jgi:cytoskeletal protein RodZ
MKFLLVAALLLPTVISAPALAIEQNNSYTIAQATPEPAENKAAATAPVKAQEEEEEEEEESENETADSAKEKATPEAVVAAGKAVSNPNQVENNNLKFELENCRRSGDKVTCNLQFTNMASTDQSISLFSDCSRVITSGKEISGLKAQIGQGSSATLISGVARSGFITFQGIIPGANQLEELEIAYDTTNGGGTIKFKDIAIQ